MSDIFISYARATEPDAKRVLGLLRELGHQVWLDEALPAHRPYAEVIEERLRGAKAVLVIWSSDAVKSHWVRAEADLARSLGTLVQVSVDGVAPPMPFNQIQCADLRGWNGEEGHPAWRKALDSIEDLLGAETAQRAIETVASRPSVPERPSVAVLPFDTQGDERSRVFAEGVVDEITVALSRYPSLFVVGSASGAACCCKTDDLRTIGRDLGVRYLLRGRVQMPAAKVRIQINLLIAETGEQIWAERFEGAEADLFQLQDEIATAVAGQIEPSLFIAETRRVVERPTSDLSAYELFLKAQDLTRQWEPKAMAEALELLEEAIRRDPKFLMAKSLGAFCSSAAYLSGWGPDPLAHRDRALVLLREALQRGASNPDVLGFAIGTLNQLHEDFDTPVSLGDRAVALNPGSSMAFFWSAWGKARHGGRPRLALRHFETAYRLDPHSQVRPFLLGGMAICLFELNQFEQAATLAKEAVTLRPEWVTGVACLVASLSMAGRVSEAAAVARRAREVPFEAEINFIKPGSELKARFREALERVTVAEKA